MTEQVNMGAAAAANPTGPNDAALAAKFDKAQEAPSGEAAPAKTERPADIPEKFWDAEKGEVKLAEMAKSYAELEKKQSGTQEEKPADKKAGEEPPASTTEVKDALKEAGLDFDTFNEEFLRDGALSDESYKKLAEKGYEKGIVDVYVAGLKAQVTSLTNAAYEGAGGEAEYAEMVTWASQNASESELAAYNAAMQTADPAQIKLAAQGMANKFAQAEGRDAARKIGGNGNGSEAGDAYGSVQEMQADMRKAEYKTDPAFRAKVAEKLGRSKIM